MVSDKTVGAGRGEVRDRALGFVGVSVKRAGEGGIKADPRAQRLARPQRFCGSCSVFPYNRLMRRFTVEMIPDPEQGGYTARVPDIPAYGEGRTEEEAIADLREALRAYVETFGLEDALAHVNPIGRADAEL
jgi:predicted RNase H-like HicB family nuclease